MAGGAAARQARAVRPAAAASCRTAPLLLAAVLAAGLAGSSDAMVQKQNTTWIYPTPGCRANRAGEDCYPFCPMPANAPCERSAVCKPLYIKTAFGKEVRWTMAAANPTPPDNVFIIRSGGEPKDEGKSCCGFHPVLAENIWSVTAPDIAMNPEGVIAPTVDTWPPMQFADVTDESTVASREGALISKNLDKINLNITWVQFTWNLTRQIDTTLAVTPLYNITYDAQYAYSLTDGANRMHNNSACQKMIVFRICSEPFFSAGPSYSTLPLLGAPKPASLAIVQNEACGLTMHTPCVISPGKLETKGVNTLNVVEMGMLDAEGNNHGVRIGEEVKLEFSLATLDMGGKVKLQTVDDPGLPIGATLSEDVACGAQKVCRTLTWTPRKGQEGKDHDAHVVGRSFSSTELGGLVDPAEEPCDQLYTRETIFRIRVMTPVSHWLEPSAHLDYSHYLQRSVMHACIFVCACVCLCVRGPLRCPGMPGIVAARRSRNSCPLRRWDRSEGVASNLLQIQPDWAGNAVVGTAFEVTMQCKSNYMPKLDMDGSAGAHFDMVGEVKDEGDGNRISTYKFSYTPMRGDEGSTKIWHFHCGDDQDVEERKVLTVAVKTKLCAYSVDAGETLSTMTRRYQLSTNWLNVWNANPMLLTDPDLDLEAGAQVRIGPVYSVKHGDTLQTVAGTLLLVPCAASSAACLLLLGILLRLPLPSLAPNGIISRCKVLQGV